MEGNESRDKILNGARELFRKYGVRSITMDDIAHHLGISKKTIYQLFTDKDDIVTLTMQTHLHTERQIFERVKQASRDAIHHMFNLTRCMKDNIKDTNASLIHDLQKYHSKAWNLFLEFKYGFVKAMIVDNLQAGIVQGYYRDDINIDILSKIRLETVTMANDDQVFPRDRYNLSELQMNLFDHFLHGIMTGKGKKLYIKYRSEFERTNDRGELYY